MTVLHRATTNPRIASTARWDSGAQSIRMASSVVRGVATPRDLDDVRFNQKQFARICPAPSARAGQRLRGP